MQALVQRRRHRVAGYSERGVWHYWMNFEGQRRYLSPDERRLLRAWLLITAVGGPLMTVGSVLIALGYWPAGLVLYLGVPIGVWALRKRLRIA